MAVKVLKETGAVALGDFRTELNVLQKVHHPHTVRQEQEGRRQAGRRGGVGVGVGWFGAQSQRRPPPRSPPRGIAGTECARVRGGRVGGVLAGARGPS